MLLLQNTIVGYLGEFILFIVYNLYSAALADTVLRLLCRLNLFGKVKTGNEWTYMRD